MILDSCIIKIWKYNYNYFCTICAQDTLIEHSGILVGWLAGLVILLLYTTTTVLLQRVLLCYYISYKVFHCDLYYPFNLKSYYCLYVW